MIDWTGIALVITASTSGIVSLVTLARVGRVRDDVAAVKSNVTISEKATNSMKDALVAKTEAEALGRGHAAGLAEGQAQRPSSADRSAEELGRLKEVDRVYNELKEKS